MCIFCKIINQEIPSEIVYQDDEVIAFNDIHPLAPVHVLVIPKKHIASMNEMAKEDQAIFGKMLFVAKSIASEKGIADGGYKLLIRTGLHGGQEVDHVHLHLIGGAQMYEKIGVE